jgi:hypothetical protein
MTTPTQRRQCSWPLAAGLLALALVLTVYTTPESTFMTLVSPALAPPANKIAAAGTPDYSTVGGANIEAGPQPTATSQSNAWPVSR